MCSVESRTPLIVAMGRLPSRVEGAWRLLQARKAGHSSDIPLRCGKVGDKPNVYGVEGNQEHEWNLRCLLHRQCEGVAPSNDCIDFQCSNFGYDWSDGILSAASVSGLDYNVLVSHPAELTESFLERLVDIVTTRRWRQNCNPFHGLLRPRRQRPCGGAAKPAMNSRRLIDPSLPKGRFRLAHSEAERAQLAHFCRAPGRATGLTFHFSPIYRQIELLNAAGALIYNRDVTNSI